MRKILHFIVLTVLSCSVFALPVDELNRQLGAFATMRGNFSQTVSTDLGRVLQTSAGKVSIDRPGKFRWDQETPMKQLIIVNDKNVTIYDPELEQVTLRTMDGAAGDTPALLLSSGAEELDAFFDVGQIPSSNPDETWFKLASKDTDSITSVIILGFKLNKIALLQLRDNLGHVTDIRFSDVILNAPVSRVLFEFTPPEGVDVMHE